MFAWGLIVFIGIWLILRDVDPVRKANLEVVRAGDPRHRGTEVLQARWRVRLIAGAADVLPAAVENARRLLDHRNLIAPRVRLRP